MVEAGGIDPRAAMPNYSMMVRHFGGGGTGELNSPLKPLGQLIDQPDFVTFPCQPARPLLRPITILFQHSLAV